MSTHQPSPGDAARAHAGSAGSAANPRTGDAGPAVSGAAEDRDQPTARGGASRRNRRNRGSRRRTPPTGRPPRPPRVPPPITYPSELPVAQRRDDLLAAIRDHQVVIVAGETGSGKTTQLPKICLELGRGAYGLIGHTQPRRLAARTVAERIAEELDTPLGSTIGYQVRFTDRVGPRSMVKVMTDGILLNEIQADRDLRKYDTLIIDEAHERSLNIDFILGHLRQLLPRRPDLKLVITSATIDPERFAQHFTDAGGRPAPIVEVSGRTYPVVVRYRPVEDAEEPDQIQAICDAVTELRREPAGDILVFASGEREIRDAADALRAMKLP
ncbi:MAG: DEAD/DEAH box helicase, partial [Micromonosporaceae bacterium]